MVGDHSALDVVWNPRGGRAKVRSPLAAAAAVAAEPAAAADAAHAARALASTRVRLQFQPHAPGNVELQGWQIDDIRVRRQPRPDVPDAQAVRNTEDAENPEILDVAFYQHKVAVSGDVMVIGSAWEKIGDQCDGGAAHVYARTPIADDSATNAQGTTRYAWTHVQKITSRDVFDYATELNTRNFAPPVAVDKDTIVVSHYVGRYVNVYTRSDPNDPTSLWTLRAKLEVPSLTHTDTEPYHWTEGFGYAVAVDGTPSSCRSPAHTPRATTTRRAGNTGARCTCSPATSRTT